MAMRVVASLRRLRPVPTVALVLLVVVLATGLRPDRRGDRVALDPPVTPPSAPAPVDAAAGLPRLGSCAETAPPCTSPSTAPATSPSSERVLHLEGGRLTSTPVDGSVGWTMGVADGSSASGGPGGSVVVAERGGHVLLLDGADGSRRWETDLVFGDTWILTAAGDASAVVVMAIPPAVDGAARVVRVLGLSTDDGSIAWIHMASTASPSVSADAVDGAIVLTGIPGDGVVSALDAATGALRWEGEIGAPLTVLSAGGQVLAASRDRLTILDLVTGRRALDADLGTPITALLSVSPTGATVDTAEGPLTIALP